MRGVKFRGGGALKKIRQGCSCYFLGSEIGKIVFFGGGLLKLRVIFELKKLALFLGVKKTSALLFGLLER